MSTTYKQQYSAITWSTMKNKTKKGKKGSGKNRGYIGYHTTWDGNRVFLRSKAEFIYARMLDKEQIPYKLECVTYVTPYGRYKPDFFIFDPSYKHILKVVEVKGLDDKKTATQYFEKFNPFFNSLGIPYEVNWKYQAVITKYQLKEEIKQWITQSIQTYDHISDVSGEHNPMYGKKHSTHTKELISKKAKERQTPEYKKQNSDRLKHFYQTEAGKKAKAHLSKARKERAMRDNPFIQKVCRECSQTYEAKLKSKKEFCAAKCSRSWNYKNIPGYGQHKNKK